MRIFSFIFLPLSPSLPPSLICFPSLSAVPPLLFVRMLMSLFTYHSFPSPCFFFTPSPYSLCPNYFILTHTWIHSHTLLLRGDFVPSAGRPAATAAAAAAVFLRPVFETQFKLLFLHYRNIMCYMYLFQKEDLRTSQCQCRWLIMVDLLWGKINFGLQENIFVENPLHCIFHLLTKIQSCELLQPFKEACVVNSKASGLLRFQFWHAAHQSCEAPMESLFSPA